MVVVITFYTQQDYRDTEYELFQGLDKDRVWTGIDSVLQSNRILNYSNVIKNTLLVEKM